MCGTGVCAGKAGGLGWMPVKDGTVMGSVQIGG